ncbi:hypothetical protein HK098_001015 [Nowakowskiella sp. JEL0407]|nr:hypothetical protein HK098_001015 [Nowakowskiella sp. JEL0407]
MEVLKNRIALLKYFTSSISPDESSSFSGLLTPEDFEKFRILCFQFGIPESPGLRSKCWKILCGYLPFAQPDSWDELLFKQRSEYYAFVSELITPGLEEYEVEQLKQFVDNTENSILDPRYLKYHNHLAEVTILEQIDRDVRRTHPDLGFFQQKIFPSPSCPLSSSYSESKSKYQAVPTKRLLFDRTAHLHPSDEFGARTHVADNNGEGIDLHWESMIRILFIWSKLNQGISYVQGMNEILAPIYYVFASDVDEDSREHAEADSFYIFTQFMSLFRDHFTRSLDNVSQASRPPSRSESATAEDSSSVIPSVSMSRLLSTVTGSNAHARKKSVGEKSMEQFGGNGIGSSMDRLMRRLRLRDLELYTHFQRLHINPAFYAFRWLTVLLTQEFVLPDLLRIWDSMIADLALDINESTPGRESFELVNRSEITAREGKFDFLIDFCCAMLVCVRSELLHGEFAENVKLLQDYPTSDVNIILQKSYEFQKEKIENLNGTATRYWSVSSHTTEKFSQFGATLSNLISKVDNVVLGSRATNEGENVDGETKPATDNGSDGTLSSVRRYLSKRISAPSADSNTSDSTATRSTLTLAERLAKVVQSASTNSTPKPVIASEEVQYKTISDKQKDPKTAWQFAGLGDAESAKKGFGVDAMMNKEERNPRVSGVVVESLFKSPSESDKDLSNELDRKKTVTEPA